MPDLYRLFIHTTDADGMLTHRREGDYYNRREAERRAYEKVRAYELPHELDPGDLDPPIIAHAIGPDLEVSAELALVTEAEAERRPWADEGRGPTAA